MLRLSFGVETGPGVVAAALGTVGFRKGSASGLVFGLATGFANGFVAGLFVGGGVCAKAKFVRKIQRIAAVFKVFPFSADLPIG